MNFMQLESQDDGHLLLIFICMYYSFKCKGLREWAIKILNLYKNRVKIRVEAPGICSIRKNSRSVIRVSTGFTMAAYSKIKEFIKIQEFYFQVRRVRSSGLVHPKRGRKWKPGGPQQNLHHGRLLSLRGQIVGAAPKMPCRWVGDLWVIEWQLCQKHGN